MYITVVETIPKSAKFVAEKGEIFLVNDVNLAEENIEGSIKLSFVYDYTCPKILGCPLREILIELEEENPKKSFALMRGEIQDMDFNFVEGSKKDPWILYLDFTLSNERVLKLKIPLEQPNGGFGFSYVLLDHFDAIQRWILLKGFVNHCESEGFSRDEMITLAQEYFLKALSEKNLYNGDFSSIDLPDEFYDQMKRAVFLQSILKEDEFVNFLRDPKDFSMYSENTVFENFSPNKPKEFYEPIFIEKSVIEENINQQQEKTVFPSQKLKGSVELFKVNNNLFRNTYSKYMNLSTWLAFTFGLIYFILINLIADKILFAWNVPLSDFTIGAISTIVPFLLWGIFFIPGFDRFWFWLISNIVNLITFGGLRGGESFLYSTARIVTFLDYRNFNKRYRNGQIVLTLYSVGLVILCFNFWLGDDGILVEKPIYSEAELKSVRGPCEPLHGNSQMAGYETPVNSYSRLKTSDYQVEFNNPKGACVYASNVGKIVDIEKADGFNSSTAVVILIEHDDGIISVYAPVGSLEVTKGLFVEKGQLLGRMEKDYLMFRFYQGETELLIENFFTNAMVKKRSKNCNLVNKSTTDVDLFSVPVVGFSRVEEIQLSDESPSGLRFYGSVGLCIYAAQAGTVETIEDGREGYNETIITVLHKGRVRTIYQNISENQVSQGQIIETGQLLGVLVNYYMRFEVSEDGSLVNPNDYLPHKFIDASFTNFDRELMKKSTRPKEFKKWLLLNPKATNTQKELAYEMDGYNADQVILSEDGESILIKVLK